LYVKKLKQVSDVKLFQKILIQLNSRKNKVLYKIYKSKIQNSKSKIHIGTPFAVVRSGGQRDAFISY
jgi:hypothetical protein